MRAWPLLVVALVLAAGCAKPATPGPALPPERATTVFGVSVSPKSFGAQDFPPFFDQAKDAGSLLLWGGSGDELATNGSAPDVTAQLAQRAGLKFMAQFAWWGSPNASFDTSRQASAREDLAAFAKARRPYAIGIGIEVNRLAASDPATFDAFAAWYPGAYDAVKAASPDTLVFPTFQYETMKGENGGLFGGDAHGAPQWDLLARFAKRDLTAFTLYPTLAFLNVSAIPDDHLADAVAHADGHPVAFVETGHFASGPSTPQDQAAFVAWLRAHVPATNATMVVWLHLYDQPSAGVAPFRSMGLVASDGAKRPAFDAWRAWAHE